MKKRIFSALLALALLLPAAAVRPDAAENALIAWNEPAIAANAGETIDLTAYSVQFEENGSASSGVKWEYEGEEVASFTPESAGVYELKAASGTLGETVYVVAKNADDKEYVLYYNGFDSADALEGFVKDSGMESRYKIENSDLVIDATGMDMVRITLPEWLGAFGNYCITARVTSTDEKDTSRWNSICYRANGASYPFYHMCVRKTCGTGSGVELAYRTPKNAWDVQDSGTHTVNQKTGTYYEYKVQIKDDVVVESIDGNGIIYNDRAKERKIGQIGLIANFSVMHVDYIKVSLQTVSPRLDVPETLAVPTAEVANITNALANIAEPANAAALDMLEGAHCVILGTDGTDIFGTDGEAICAIENVFDKIGKNIIPVFRCDTKTAVDGVVKTVKLQKVPDATVLSADAEILAYARSKQQLLRGVIDLRGRYDHVLTSEDIAEARLLINGSAVKTGLFDAGCLDQAAAEELRSMLLTVWAYTNAQNETDTVHALLTGAHGIVTPSPEKVVSAYSLFDSDALTRTPVIIGHRGNPTNAPENSISSYRIAYKNGADIVETDVYLSKDGEVVVMHDSDISRTTTGTGNIESLTLEQLKSYNLWGEGDKFKSQFPDEKIPTLRKIFELMRECEGLKLFIEIKTSKIAVCEKIVELAKEYGMMERISVISFSIDQCANMHKYAPEISCGYLMGAPKGSASPELAANALNAVIGQVVSRNTTFNPAYTTLTYDFLQAANARGVTVWPWTYAASAGEKFAYAFKSGFGGLTTNDAQYTKDNVKYIRSAPNITSAVGCVRELDVSAATYGKRTLDVSSRVSIKVISGGDIVSAEGNKLTGLKEGTAYIMCGYSTSLPVGRQTGSYTLYTDIIRVDVIAADGGIMLESASGFKYADGIVSGVAPGVTVRELKNAVISPALELYGGEKKARNTDILRTGFTLKDASGETAAVIAVTGDINCDGKCSADDIPAMAQALVEADVCTKAQNAAGDIDGSGCTNVTDYILLKLMFAGEDGE